MVDVEDAEQRGLQRGDPQNLSSSPSNTRPTAHWPGPRFPATEFCSMRGSRPAPSESSPVPSLGQKQSRPQARRPGRRCTAGHAAWCRRSWSTKAGWTSPAAGGGGQWPGLTCAQAAPMRGHKPARSSRPESTGCAAASFCLPHRAHCHPEMVGHTLPCSGTPKQGGPSRPTPAQTCFSGPGSFHRRKL